MTPGATIRSDDPAFATVKELAARLKTCTKTVMRMVQRGMLPKPVALSSRCLRFDMAEVRGCLEKAKERGGV
jgi:predicted DNA-binding transcriptional regulator AlpA